MSRDPSIVINEMIETILYLDRTLSDHDLASFSRNLTLKLATQRALEMISEASRHLPAHLTASEPRIDWRKIHGMGNFLRHEYHHIQDEIVWDVARNRLEDLKAALLRMRQHLSSPHH